MSKNTLCPGVKNPLAFKFSLASSLWLVAARLNFSPFSSSSSFQIGFVCTSVIEVQRISLCFVDVSRFFIFTGCLISYCSDPFLDCSSLVTFLELSSSVRTASTGFFIPNRPSRGGRECRGLSSSSSSDWWDESFLEAFFQGSKEIFYSWNSSLALVESAVLETVYKTHVCVTIVDQLSLRYYWFCGFQSLHHNNKLCDYIVEFNEIREFKKTKIFVWRRA